MGGGALRGRLLDFTDSEVWFAPTTLFWCAVMLLAPGALICAYQATRRLLRRPPGPSRQEQLRAGVNYFAISPYGEVLVYAFLSQVAPGAFVAQMDKAGRYEGLALFLHPTAGVAAAAALTLMLTVALEIAGLVAALLAARYRQALLREDGGLVAIILLFSGAAGCATAAIWCLLLGPRLALVWLVLGAVFVTIALARLRRHAPGPANTYPPRGMSR